MTGLLGTAEATLGNMVIGTIPPSEASTTPATPMMEFIDLELSVRRTVHLDLHFRRRTDSEVEFQRRIDIEVER